jgi:hypothetical protein
MHAFGRPELACRNAGGRTSPHRVWMREFLIQYARRFALGSGFCALSARGTFVRFAFASIVSRTVVSSDSRRRSLQNPKRGKLTLAAEPRALQNVDG